MSTTKNRINEEITAPRVVLIDVSGQSHGEMPLSEALMKSQSEGMDLVEVSDSKIPVCRIMDYGKKLFREKKKQKEARKLSKSNEVKEIRLSPAIDHHDLVVKSRKVRQFIDKGMKVRLDIRLKGRERKHLDLVDEVVTRFHQLVRDIAEIQSQNGDILFVPK